MGISIRIFLMPSGFRGTAENESLIWKHLPLFGFRNTLVVLMYQMFDRPYGLRYNSLAIKEKYDGGRGGMPGCAGFSKRLG